MQNDYDEKDVTDIINIFSTHGVSIEFRYKKQLLDAILKVAKRIEKIALTSRFKKTRVVKLLEYDVTDMKVISTGIGYPIRFFDYCPEKNAVTKQINVLIEMFSFYRAPAIDFMANFGMMYSGDAETNWEGNYYWVNQEIMGDIIPSDRRKFLELLEITENHTNFICDNYQTTVLGYVGFDTKTNLVKCAFGVPTQSFLIRNPSKYYSDYTHINDVIELISDIPDEEGISLQLSCRDADYFAIEEDIYDVVSFQSRLKQIYDKNIIDNETYERILNFSFPDTTHYIFKYRWSNSNNFQLKIYTEKVF